MKTVIRTYLPFAVIAAMLFVVAAAGSASAQQNGSGPSREQREEMLRGRMDALGRAWKQAWDRNRDVKNARARALLDQARTQIDEARGALIGEAAGPMDQVPITEVDIRLRTAEQLIRRALELMGPVAGSGSAGSTQGPRASIDEAENIMQHVGRVGGGGPHFEQVELMIRQAREAEARGNHDMASRLAERAQERGRYLLHESMRNRAMDRRADALDGVVESLVDRAERLAAASNDENMVALAERAREHLGLAQQMQDESQAPNRSRLLAATMREAETVIRTLDRAGFAQHRAEQSIADAEAALNRAREVAGEDADAQLTQGEELLAGARERLSESDVMAAQRMANQAREIARRAIQESLGPISDESVSDAISRTDEFIAQTEASVGDNPTAVRVIETARQRQQEARRLLAEGDLRQALAQTRVAARLAERARQMGE